MLSLNPSVKLRQLSTNAFKTCSRSYSSMNGSSLFKTYFVAPEALRDALLRPPSNMQAKSKIVPLCVSWFLPNDPEKRTGLQVFEQGHIPTAKFLDIDKVKDHNSPYPHMLPTKTDFEVAMSDLGISNDDCVVVYDSKELGLFSAPRGAWMLKEFGHSKVHILNNFKVWAAKGFPMESGPQGLPEETTCYQAVVSKPSAVVDFEEIKAFAETHPSARLTGATVLDARPNNRWTGQAPEPRPGLSSGHVPGSISLPFTDVLDPTTRVMLPPEELRKVFDRKGVNISGTVVSSCGTGVTAAVIDAAIAEVDGGTETGRYIYDGSWTEYAQRADPKLINKIDS